jgi:streptogramin lyase
MNFVRLSACAFVAALLAACAGTGTGTGGSSNGTNPATNAAARTIHKAGALQFQVFTAGQTPGFPATAGAIDVAPGPNQTMWFTDAGTPAIGRIASDGTVTEFTSGLPQNAEPNAIAAGPDGNMYFSDYRGVVIGKITSDGTITEYSAPKFTDTNSKAIAFGSDGLPWVVGSGVPSVLAHLTSAGKITTQKLAADFTPDSTLAADAGGNLWFTGVNKHLHGELLERVASSGKLVHLPMHMVKQFLPCCPNQAATQMTIGPNGVPWFTTTNYLKLGTTAFHLGTVDGNAVKLLRLTHNGLSTSAYPSGIASTGASNTVWVSGGNPFQNNGALWEFVGKQNQKAFSVPYNPLSLTVDAAGHPWFTATFSGEPSQIVEVTNAGSN